MYEPKYDGFRALVTRNGSDITITGRNSERLARSFPEVVEAALHALPDHYTFDGEITATTSNGFAFDALSRSYSSMIVL